MMEYMETQAQMQLEGALITEYDGSQWVDAESIRAALAKLDAADKDCPIRKSRRFVEACPRCGATVNQGCGLWDSAAVDFIAEVRRMMSDG